MNRPRSIHEQLDFENRRDAYEQHRLEQAVWDAQAKVKKATPKQLKAAAALANHAGVIGFVGRCAAAELKRRGLT